MTASEFETLIQVMSAEAPALVEKVRAHVASLEESLEMERREANASESAAAQRTKERDAALDRITALEQEREAFATACRDALGPQRATGTPEDVALLGRDRDAARGFSVQFGQERDAAIADNAALMHALSFSLKEGCGCGWMGDEPDAHKPGVQCPVRTVQMNAVHPGAALLEEHRKQVAVLTLARDVLEAMHEAAQKARLSDQEEHRKALARARNEGLDEAAKHLDDERMGGAPCAMVLSRCAEAIRAMKEPDHG